MTNYEIMRKTDREKAAEINLAGVSIVITENCAVGQLRISTNRILTQSEELTLRNALENRGYKLIWKDGVLL